MANNRLYIRCRQCGEVLFLGKHFISPWSFDKDTQGKWLEEFFDEHCFCQNNIYNENYNTFELVTECGEGYPEMKNWHKFKDENGEDHFYVLDEDLDYSKMDYNRNIELGGKYNE